MLTDGSAIIARESISRFKDKVRLITKRSRGVKFDTIIRELNQATRGWFHYFKCADFPKPMKHLDGWIRRRLRSYRIKQRKRKFSIKTFLTAHGVSSAVHLPALEKLGGENLYLMLLTRLSI